MEMDWDTPLLQSTRMLRMCKLLSDDIRITRYPCLIQLTSRENHSRYTLAYHHYSEGTSNTFSLKGCTCNSHSSSIQTLMSLLLSRLRHDKDDTRKCFVWGSAADSKRWLGTPSGSCMANFPGIEGN